MRPITTYGTDTEVKVLAYHQVSKTYAAIGVRYPAEPANLFTIDFYTIFSDNSFLLTMNGRLHAIIGEIPNAIANDPYAVTLEAQWRSHEDKLIALTSTQKAIALAPEKFVEALEDAERLYLDRMLQTQKISPAPETEFFQLSWQLAWQTTVKLQRGMSKITKINKQRAELAKKDPVSQTVIPIELEIESFNRVQRAEQGSLKRGFGIWLLLVSLVLFTASFAAFVSPISLVAIAGVIFFHEIGHYLMMRLCGYADTTVFFIPFFGAAATGRKDHASVLDKFLVLIAGPMPGLIVGMGLFLFSTYGWNYPEWLTEVMWMLIGLNLFNLMPIYPLDGGKIVDLLFFSRYPFTDVLFKVIAVVAFLLLSQASPLLISLAIIVAITIPASFRSAQLFSSLRKELKNTPTPDRDGLLPTIFIVMRLFGHDKLPASQRYSLAKTALQRCQEVRSQRSSRIGLIALYLVCLFSLPAVAIARYATAWLPPFREAALKESRLKFQLWQKQFNAKKMAQINQVLKVNPKDRKALTERGDLKRGAKDYKGANSDYTKAIALNLKDADVYIKRGDLRNELKQHQVALADYTAALKLNPQSVEIILKQATTYKQLGNHQNVLKQAEVALRLDPNNLQAYYYRRDTRRQLGDIQGADQDTQKIAALEQIESKQEEIELDDRAINSSSGFNRLFQQRLVTANIALNYNSKDRKAYTDRATANSMLKKYKAAIADYSKALQLYPKDIDVYMGRSRAYNALKDYRNAIDDANRIINLDPEQTEAYAIRSDARRKLGDVSGAEQDLQKLNQLSKLRS